MTVTENEIDKVCINLKYPSGHSYNILCLNLAEYIYHNSSSEEKLFKNVSKFCESLVNNLDNLSIQKDGRATQIKITVDVIDDIYLCK